LAKKTSKKSQIADKPQVKDRIVQAAIRCYLRQGIGATRSVDIAREAKIAPPLFSYYYPTNDALFADVVQQALSSLRDASVAGIEKAGSDVLGALQGYVDAPFDWARKNPELYTIWLFFYYQASFSEVFERISQEIRQGGRDRISFLLYRGLEQGVFSLPPSLSVGDAALAIQSILTGAFVIAGTEGKKQTDWKRASRSALHTIHALILSPKSRA
jgi:AcrR family transcriptional regulator